MAKKERIVRDASGFETRESSSSAFPGDYKDSDGKFFCGNVGSSAAAGEIGLNIQAFCGLIVGRAGQLIDSAPEKPREITPPRRVSAKPDPEPAGPAAPPTPTGPPGPPNRKKSQRWSASDVAQRPGAVQNPPAPGNKRNVLQRKKSLKEMGQAEESMLVALVRLRPRLRPRVERPYMAFLHEGVARGRSLSSRIKS